MPLNEQTRLTFEQIIARANERGAHLRFHVFQEFSDGRRGYYDSRGTYSAARRLASMLKAPIIYDRTGEAVD
ncbi:hypothetical protein [Rhizobium phage RHph_X2_26]|nr:hypothetical protein [Rhizobium phage RHph_X2_26]